VLQDENNRLRDNIVQMGNELNPDHSESHYTRDFEKLKDQIEGWVTKHEKFSSSSFKLEMPSLV